jgi:UDP-N-acetylglucosamine acyltransferase
MSASGGADVHPSAVVEPGARLGDGVRVGPFCYVQSAAEIGAGTELVSHVAVLAHATIGGQCRLHAGAVVGDLPQDIAYSGEESYVRVGDRCRIREGVTVHRGTAAGSSTVVGDDCMLMANSHLAHNVQLGARVTLANGVLLAGHVEVGDGVFMGGGAVVHQFARIGRLAMISGLTAVKRDVPPFCMTRALTAGIMGLNTVGLRRAGVGADDRLALKRAFKLLYRSSLNVTQALELIEAELDNDPVRELVTFVRASRRGIAPHAGRAVRDEDPE